MAEPHAEPGHSLSRTYDDALLGFREYWYPVASASSLMRRPRPVQALGERLLLVREGRGVFAIEDRCAHRGVPLSIEPRREFPGTVSCPFHGWTYDLQTGRLVAAITDGPDSAICGKVTLRTYPAEERAGLIWVFMGDGPAPPVESDVPPELLQADAVCGVVVELRRGNWRYAVETGIDEAHGKYLHRTSIWMLFRELPTWSRIHMVPSDDAEGWLVRTVDEVGWETYFPGLGRWPRDSYLGPFRKPWKQRGKNATEVAVRLPGQLRVRQWGWTDYEIWVPVDEQRHLAVFVGVKRATGFQALLWRLRFAAYVRPLYYGRLNAKQDQLMIEHLQSPPERLFRPDVSITSWRRLCDQPNARRRPAVTRPVTTANDRRESV